jgi:alkaline phosphatase D
MYLKTIFLLAVVSVSFISFSQGLAQNMYPDAHWPFIHGVTSGDPTVSKVIIWTRIESNQNETVIWQMSQDSSFSSIDQFGYFSTNAQRDWTVKIDVANLMPYTTYYYRFQAANGNFSDVGRTKTAPDGAHSHSRITLMSCSSIYSGYFNAYRRIAERKDLDLVIHVGDYIYDFVDPDEQVRIPNPFPIDPESLSEYRDRHKYYLMDPDLRDARKTHPWVVLWDNHDVDMAVGQEMAPVQAFLEYLPVRLSEPQDSMKIYRKISYGNLMDILVTDVLMYKGQDLISPNNPSMIGNVQYQWLTNELSNSNAKWKLIPSQNLMAGWSVQNLPAFIGIGNNGVLDNTNWDGYDADRDRVLNHIKDNGIDNVIWLTGDSHVTIYADLSTDPQNPAMYNGTNGTGSIAVEFLPTSISRGNFDEMGFGWALGLVTPIMAAENPNHVHFNYLDHGYGLLDIKPDSVVAEIWYSDKLNITSEETFSKGFVVKDTENRWNRTPTTAPTPSINESIMAIDSKVMEEFSIFPNPTIKELCVSGKGIQTATNFQLISIDGGKSHELKYTYVKEKDQMKINAQNIPSGTYVLRFDCNKKEHAFNVLFQ